MTKLKFEYRIVLAYILIGGLWIAFSDQLLNVIVADRHLLVLFSTYKGWFYVFVTAALFWIFLKKYLSKLRDTETELEKHRNNLQQLVEEKTRELDDAIEELSATNDELYIKNGIINQQNAELTEALQQLKETQSQLFQAEKMASLGVLTAGVAHEINNPLNYILGGITGLENYFRDQNIRNERVDLFIESAKTGVDRVSAIVSGLNQFSRSRETYGEDCEIHSIIDNCLVIINNQLKGRVEIIREYSDQKIIFPGNVGQLHQVFINILVNSSQSICTKGAITIATSVHKNEATIAISDNGCGISEENISKITDPFFTTKDPGKGTGLGLAITYNIIQAHGGKIHFQSELNKGTTVKITLPHKKNPNA
jgi:signal transduction histidine kinase